MYRINSIVFYLSNVLRCKFFHSTAEIHDPECVNCNMFPLCQGGCNSNRLLYGDKFSCPPSKTIINKLVLEYYKYLENDNSFLRR